MCAMGKGKFTGQGDGLRMRVRDLRTLGHWRRVSRNEVPRDQDG